MSRNGGDISGLEQFYFNPNNLQRDDGNQTRARSTHSHGALQASFSGTILATRFITPASRLGPDAPRISKGRPIGAPSRDGSGAGVYPIA